MVCAIDVAAVFIVLLFFTPQFIRAREPRLRPPPGPVPRYDLAEFGIQLDRKYSRPFDPSEIELTLLLESPSRQRLAVPAFYYQPCETKMVERRSKEWIYPTGKPQWKARFAPTEIGTYRATARLIDERGSIHSSLVSFDSIDTDNRGFLRVNAKAPRYLTFDDGQVFFAIGQNLAFIGPAQAITPAGATDVFEQLAQNEANFVRIWTGCQDWALAIESPRSAWGRSWSNDLPIFELPELGTRKAVRIGNSSGDTIFATPYDSIPVRPRTLYRLTGKIFSEGDAQIRIEPTRVDADEVLVQPEGSGERSFEHVFQTGENQYFLGRIGLTRVDDADVWLTALSLREAAGGPDLLADADPNLPRRGVYHQVDAFVLDRLVESARAKGIYLQLCVTMRDLYMPALKDPTSPEYDEAIRDAQNLMRYFVARWGYSTSVAVWEYFNEMNPDRPTDRFYTELAEYLDRIDPYRHPRTTSTWATSHRDWQHPRLDSAQEHFYLRPSTLAETPDVVAAVLDRARDLREHSANRPVFLAEFGLADEKWGLSPRMRKDTRLEHFHNALWASSLSGLSGTAMFWWWEQLDRRNAYHHYRPVANYLKTVPFADERLEPGDAKVVFPPRKIVAVGIQNSDHAYYWLYDRDNSWERRSEKPSPAEVNVDGAEIRLTEMQPGRYAIEWWDTWQGTLVRRDRGTASEDVLVLPIPTFAHDIACQITPE